MRILALDLGTRTGWALWDGSRTESGVQTFDVKRGESPGMRYVRFNTWLGQIFAVSPPQLVVYEQVIPTTSRYAGASTREIAAGFSTRVQEKCAAMGINHTAVYPSTLKKHVTGHGVCPKSEMVERIRKRWAPWVRDDNEADAIGLVYYARAVIVGEENAPCGRAVTGADGPSQ